MSAHGAPLGGVRARRLAWRRLVESTFEMGVVVSWAIVGVAFLLSPEGTARHSPVGHVVAFALVLVWSMLYIAGGSLAAFGLLRAQVSFRVAGLVLLATGLLMQGIAAAEFHLEPRVAVYFIYATACAGRALALVLYEHRERR